MGRANWDCGRRLAAGLSVALWAVAAGGAEPFSIRAELSPDETDPEVTVTITVADRHYLYADRVDIQSLGATSLHLRRQPAPVRKRDPLSGEIIDALTGTVTWVYGVAGAPADSIEIVVQYQGCSETTCFLPRRETVRLEWGHKRTGADQKKTPELRGAVGEGSLFPKGFQVVGRTSGYLGVREFLRFLDAAEQGRAADDGALGTSWAEGRWVWSAILVLLGGLTLNLTPCVLPLIPVTLAILGVGASSGSRARGVGLGVAYGAGMALAYGAAGAAVALTGGFFGSWSSSAGFNLSVSAVFLVLGLAMFEVVPIDFSRWRSRRGTLEPPGTGRGLTGAFFLGAVTALLAGACVAPVVLSVLVLAATGYSQGQPAALLLPFVLGVGMALPWPFVGAGLSVLPKPGRWMVMVKRGFGVIILTVAVWYAWVGVQRLRSPKPEAPGEPDEKKKEALHWGVSLEEAWHEAARTGRPVLIDFWATWCKNCHAMDETTFRHRDVVKRLESWILVKVQAEQPRDPGTKAILEAFDVRGLPTYVVLRPRDFRTKAGGPSGQGP